ncbi:MAG: hypothetical protein P8103_13015 [Candidatus Thiodiazotropha sp.]
MRGEKGVFKKDLIKSENSRLFLDGSIRNFEVLKTAGIGFGTYQPGWQWSVHAGPQTGKPSERHVGYVLSGRFIITDTSGNELEVGPNEAFEIEPGGDARVYGSEACTALDFVNIHWENNETS